MQFRFDTNHCEKLNLKITKQDYKEGTPAVVQNFCFGIASFFIEFALKLDCDEKQAKGLKDICLKAIENYIDKMIKDGLLNQDEDEVNEEELKNLVEQLEKNGFDEAEIKNVIEIVKNAGGIEAATGYFQSVLDKELSSRKNATVKK